MIWLIAAAWAGGFEVAQQGAVPAGTGHAGTARDGDATAAWFNPAALADDGGLRFAAGAALASARIDAKALSEAPEGAWAASTEPGLATPPHLYASYARGAWAGGVSLNAAFAGGVRWPTDWVHRFDIVESRPTFLRIAPFAAVDLGRVRLAAGPHLDAGSLYVDRATDHVAEEGEAQLLLRGHGFGGHAAVWVAASDEVCVGLTYKSRTALRLAGDADFDLPAAFASDYPDQGVTADWTLPDRLVAGVAIDAGAVRLLADAGLTLWSVNDALAFDFEDPDTPDTTQANGWRDSVALRLGGEWSRGALALRAGGYVDGVTGAPPPAETLSPSSPDSTRVGVTVGGGWTHGALSADVFYEHLRLLPRSSRSADAPLASYRGFAHVAGATIALRFPQ